MSQLDRDTLAAAGLSPLAAKLSRYFDVLVLVAVFFTLTAAFHLHSMLSAGDWDMWVDWKDRRFWVIIMPVVWVTFPAAVQFGLWTHFRLPIGATACMTFLLIGTWITRWVQFDHLAYLPYSLMFPATALASALALDAVLLLTRNHFFTAIVGGGLFGLLFFPTNWPLLAAYHLPVEHLGQQVSVADLIGYTFNRTAMPEYLRIIERGTLRTYGDNAVVVSMFFSSFLCMLMYFLWWYIGAALASPKFIPNGLSHMMGLGRARKPSPALVEGSA